MFMSETIAECELIGRRSSGQEFRVLVSIGQPEPTVEDSPVWTCCVVVSPLARIPFIIYGQGSLQSLCLGARHAVQTLATFVEQGGVLTHTDGELFDPEVFGFKILPGQP